MASPITISRIVLNADDEIDFFEDVWWGGDAYSGNGLSDICKIVVSNNLIDRDELGTYTWAYVNKTFGNVEIGFVYFFLQADGKIAFDLNRCELANDAQDAPPVSVVSWPPRPTKRAA